jgi:hypothetical protein
MTVTSEQIEGFAESRFEGLTREQLRDAGKILGADFGPNTAERTNFSTPSDGDAATPEW